MTLIRRLIVITCSIFLIGGEVTAQKHSPIQCSADLLQYDQDLMEDIQVFTGNVVFRHEGSIGYADTVFYNRQTNTLDAFGKEIIIHINDSTHLYGRCLHYDGESRIATIDRDVMLFDNYSVLYTDRMVFYRDENMAEYTCGGKIVNDSATMTSHKARYFTNTSTAHFQEDVHILHPDFDMQTDSLLYNTAQKTAHFITFTTMHSDSSTIYCKDGWFDTQRKTAEFYQNAQIYSEGMLLTGDTIHYDHSVECGWVRSNACLLDTAEHHSVSGDYLEYNGRENCAFATQHAMLSYVGETDTLFLHADTLWADLDTTRHLKAASAYPGVRFFRKDFQGRCGRLDYWVADSMAQMSEAPLLWTDSNQILADTVRIFIQNQEPKEAHLLHHAFVSENVLEESHFNQVKGETMYVYFKENHLDYALVENEASCLYYIQEKDSSLIGVHKAEAERMRIFFEDDEISSITFYRKIKGEFGPEAQKQEERLLPEFIWLSSIRPKEKSDIFQADHHQPVLRENNDNDEDE